MERWGPREPKMTLRKGASELEMPQHNVAHFCWAKFCLSKFRLFLPPPPSGSCGVVQ